MTEEKKKEKFLKSAPKLREKDIAEINRIFPAYIFRRKKTREIWTTCCGRHETLCKDDLLLQLPHTPEPDHYGRRTETLHSKCACPYCGQQATIKELGRTGNRDNLCRWKRAMLFRWYKNALWATAYDCAKDYKAELTAPPICNMLAVYRFRPGCAEEVCRYLWGNRFHNVITQDHGLEKGRWLIHAPWNANSDEGIGCSLIGLSEIAKSPFKYCQYEEFGTLHKGFAPWAERYAEFLTACCFYPRQIEMLMKAGMKTVVKDFVGRGVKHATVFRWEETDPARAFRLNRQELKDFLATNRNIEIAETYLAMKRQAPMSECSDWIQNGLDLRDLLAEAKKWNISREKLARYLRGFVGCAKYGGMSSIGAAMRCWKDYLTAAEALNYPLHHENVLMPKGLKEAHETATGRHREQLRAEQDRIQAARDRKLIERMRQREKEYEDRKKKLDRKYSFALEEFEIRVPKDAEDILAEGRALKHCVGGYAERHISGSVVILFMRNRHDPETPWLTIEMNGNQLVQIHGYKNEGLFSGKGRFAPDPREVYAEWLDTWLAWLKAGSKRNEDGTPKLPKKKGAAA